MSVEEILQEQKRQRQEKKKLVRPTMVPPAPPKQKPAAPPPPKPQQGAMGQLGDAIKGKVIQKLATKAVSTAMGIPLPFNMGGNVPYFQIGGNSGKYPGGLSPAGMIRQFMRLKELDDDVKSKGRGEAPVPNIKMAPLGPAGPRIVRAQQGQMIPLNAIGSLGLLPTIMGKGEGATEALQHGFIMPEFKPKKQSNDKESYFQRFERTGQLGTGIPNVYVTPQAKGATVSYERNDVLPFTSIWNMMFGNKGEQ